jgi:exodeoxyribonuclease VIII
VADRYQIMLDIETLGKKPDAVVLSVGAAVMDMATLTIVDRKYWLLDHEDQDGRSIDADTVLWWLQQSDAARSAFRSQLQESPEQFAFELGDLFTKYATTTPWANGTNFDLPILADLVREYRKPPWGYRHQDMRSLATVMENVLSWKDYSKQHNPTAHNALDDAVCQANYVLECMRWIRDRSAS